MAAITTAVVAGAGLLMSYYGSQQAAKASKKAGKLNAEDAAENARLAREKAVEDERQFRLTFKREQGSNVAAIGASGVKQEGSPLEVLQDNVSSMEQDVINIRKGGQQQAASYLRQGRMARQSGNAQASAYQTQGAASLLSGAANTYSTYKNAGG